MSKRGCSMTVDWEARYNRCKCGFVRRAWWAKPLINNGGKP